MFGFSFLEGADTLAIEVILIVFTATITFLLGRYTSHLEDRRTGMKEIDQSFYKPFLSLYKNARHAYALFFVDIDFNVQRELIKILLDNIEIVSPRLKRKIYDLDQWFSGYAQGVEEGIEMSEIDKGHVELCFNSIYNYIEKQYTQNERKLYCSFWKRMNYKMQDLFMK